MVSPASYLFYVIRIATVYFFELLYVFDQVDSGPSVSLFFTTRQPSSFLYLLAQPLLIESYC